MQVFTMKALRDKLASFFSGLFGRRRPAERVADGQTPEQPARQS